MNIWLSIALAFTSFITGWSVARFGTGIADRVPTLAITLNESEPATAAPPPLPSEPDETSAVADDRQTPAGGAIDVVIRGQGFLQVLLPNGEFAYTRDGHVRPNSAGQLVIGNNYLVQPGVCVPQDTLRCNIDSDGTVLAVTRSNPTQCVIIGNLTLTRFHNPMGLSPLGNRLFAQTWASGHPIQGLPGAKGFGTFRQGYLEVNNAQYAAEMIGLITSQLGLTISEQTDEISPMR